MEYGGYALGEDNKWHKQWVLVDAPTPPPRTFSKYKLVAALMQAEVWTQVKAWIEGVPGAYDLYLAAEDISEDEPLLAQGIAAVKELLSWTDEQVEAILREAAARQNGANTMAGRIENLRKKIADLEVVANNPTNRLAAAHAVIAIAAAQKQLARLEATATTNEVSVVIQP